MSAILPTGPPTMENVVPEVSNNSSIFIHENADNCNFILIIVHDKPRDGSGGSVTMTSTGTPSRVEMRDDRPSELQCRHR